MIHPYQSRRRVLRDICRLGAIGSAVMLVLASASLWSGTGPPAAAASAGPAEVIGAPGTPAAGQSLTSGGSASAFTFRLPAGAACSGDSASGGYRVQSYMVPSAVDPQTLKFNFLGPNPAGSGASYSQALFRADSGLRYVNVTTGIASTAGGPGLLPTLPGFDFKSSVSVPGFVLPGTYNIGIACSKAAGAEMDKFWNVEMTFAADSADVPSGLTWTVSGTPTTTTTTVAGATTTTTVAGATTTTVAGATTTTVAGATTTTVAGATTTTPVGAAQAATLSPAAPTAGGSYRVTHPNCRVGETITVTQAQSTPAVGTATCAVPVAGLVRPQQAAAIGTATVTFTAAPTAPGTYTVTSTGATSGTRTATFVIAAVTTTTAVSSGGNPSGTLTGTIPATGSSTTSMMVWGVLLLVFGRMAILFGRKPKVIPAGR